MNIKELMEKRANLITQAREIVDLADTEERELSPEENDQYNQVMDQAADLAEDITRREKLAAAESSLNQSAHDPMRPDPEQDPDLDPAAQGRAAPEYRAAYASYLRGGVQGLTGEETRALQSDQDDLGGYLVTPVQFVQDLIQAVDNMVFMQQWGTVYQIPTAESLGAASLDTDPADPTWTSELAIGTEDSDMAFGKRELNPSPLAKFIKISRKLLRQVPSVEALVRDRLAYKIGITAENAYQNGSGANQPLGVFTASTDGISTGRDVSTGNEATSIKFDGLIEAKFTLKPQYWAAAKWLFHRDGVKQIAKLKDGEGQYIWRESVRVGEPDRILGLPSFMSEYTPNTFTTGLYVGILGDFSYYWIAIALDMEIQRLVELYAATNQVGFISRLEGDGMPVLEEAFVRVKLA